MVDARDAAEDLLLCFADDQNMYHDHQACIDIVISGVAIVCARGERYP